MPNKQKVNMMLTWLILITIDRNGQNRTLFITYQQLTYINKEERKRSKKKEEIPNLKPSTYFRTTHRVMLDSDLAVLYQVPTGRLNEAVKRNIRRFPEDFMFQLTQEEFKT